MQCGCSEGNIAVCSMCLLKQNGFLNSHHVVHFPRSPTFVVLHLNYVPKNTLLSTESCFQQLHAKYLRRVTRDGSTKMGASSLSLPVLGTCLCVSEQGNQVIREGRSLMLIYKVLIQGYILRVVSSCIIVPNRR